MDLKMKFGQRKYCTPNIQIHIHFIQRDKEAAKPSRKVHGIDRCNPTCPRPPNPFRNVPPRHQTEGGTPGWRLRGRRASQAHRGKGLPGGLGPPGTAWHPTVGGGGGRAAREGQVVGVGVGPPTPTGCLGFQAEPSLRTRGAEIHTPGGEEDAFYRTFFRKPTDPPSPQAFKPPPQPKPVKILLANLASGQFGLTRGAPQPHSTAPTQFRKPTYPSPVGGLNE